MPFLLALARGLKIVYPWLTGLVESRGSGFKPQQKQYLPLLHLIVQFITEINFFEKQVTGNLNITFIIHC